jgi:hypothetical protein
MKKKNVLLAACSLAFLSLTSACLADSSASDPAGEGVISAKAAGARGDGAVDDTVAIQKALDEAGQSGGRVWLPPGKYLVKGSLRIPPGVMLQGALDSPVWITPLKGTVILATGGRDKEEAPPLFDLGNSATVRGLSVYYPEQQIADVHPYPWTFRMQGFDNTVENVTLINSYNGIRVGPGVSGRHRIRSVSGCVLRRGILVEYCIDIGRIENVQFHSHWWSDAEVGGVFPKVTEYMWKNLEAFTFGRTDWEYVNNTFVFPVKTGYRFIQTEHGAANGQFSGIGADESQVCVKVEAVQPMGLLIANGQFVAMHGDVRTQVIVDKTCAGSVRLVNCAFWGPAHQNVLSHSGSFVSLSDCYFSSAGQRLNPGFALVEADGGKLQVRGCSFGTDEPDIALRKGLGHAIITGNNGVNGVEIVNEIGAAAIVSGNEPFTPPPAGK